MFGNVLRSLKSTLYSGIDSRVPLVNRPFQTGFPVLVSREIRTYYRVMNLPHPEDPLPICGLEARFSIYDSLGMLQAEHRLPLEEGCVKGFDLLELSGFDSSSVDPQVGWCSLDLVPNGVTYFGTLRGYIQFCTANRVASLHLHPYSLKAMRFFMAPQGRIGGHLYVFLHNKTEEPLKIWYTLSDPMGNSVAGAESQLPSFGSALHSIDALFSEQLDNLAGEPHVLQIGSTHPVAPTYFYWDRKSGLITAQHH